jgi:uncharacterized protein (TIGR00299 family) protein
LARGTIVKVAHFDCFSGISGDMALGALIDAGVDANAIRQGLDSLGLPIRLEVEKVRKGGFAATYVRVEAPPEEQHRFLPDVEAILQAGKLTPPQQQLAQRIFRRLAEAEAAAHGLPLEKVHFHEVGALDSIADIVGTAIALDLLGVEHITSRSVPTGNGMVQCAHGLIPIPAPGTAELLRGVPLAPSSIQAELTTPTGAAILTTIVREWVEGPVMTIEKVGYGAGKRTFPEQPNLLRVFLGTQESSPGYEIDRVWVLETNLDDLPAEVIGYCYELLLTAGALDVFSTPIFMKKNRPGVMLSVLAPEASLLAVEEILFRETTTLGVRRYLASRHKLPRQECTVRTPWGPVKGKLGWRQGQPPVFSPEYEDCARLARAHGVPLREVYDRVREAYERGTSRGSSQ